MHAAWLRAASITPTQQLGFQDNGKGASPILHILSINVFKNRGVSPSTHSEMHLFIYNIYSVLISALLEDFICARLQATLRGYVALCDACHGI